MVHGCINLSENSSKPGIGDSPNFLRRFTKVVFSTFFASSDKQGSTEKESRKFLNQLGWGHSKDRYINMVNKRRSLRFRF